MAIGFSEQIRARREAAGVEGPVVDAILDCSAEWVAAGKLKTRVKVRSGGSPRTVIRRLDQLVKLGALEKRGQTSSTEYRSTGLLG